VTVTLLTTNVFL